MNSKPWAIRAYFYKLVARYLSFYVDAESSLIEVNPTSFFLSRFFKKIKYFISGSAPDFVCASDPSCLFELPASFSAPDFYVLNGNLHFEKDIGLVLEKLYAACHPETRVLILYFSRLWEPLAHLASFLGIRRKASEDNWIAHEDLDNLLKISGFELVRSESRVLLPLEIPFLSDIVNRFLSPLPFFQWFNLVNLAVARPLKAEMSNRQPSVSVIIPARNEAGNIERLLERMPSMGPSDELIFVEGHSDDATWERILEVQKKYSGRHRILAIRQRGEGKGDAVRAGFAEASRDILMILDADLAVAPEDLPKFYRAIVTDKGEFINGSRLVYPMERRAMRFFNVLGNKFFAFAFSKIIGQTFKDTLCGTKVLSRAHYLKLEKNRSYFGDFDPFGDFDLLFGAAKLGLKIIELPVAYRERTYGKTNIRRWSEGFILLRMMLFAARKLEFI